MLPRAILALVTCATMCEQVKLVLVIVRPSSFTGCFGCLYSLLLTMISGYLTWLIGIIQDLSGSVIRPSLCSNSFCFLMALTISWPCLCVLGSTLLLAGVTIVWLLSSSYQVYWYLIFSPMGAR